MKHACQFRMPMVLGNPMTEKKKTFRFNILSVIHDNVGELSKLVQLSYPIFKYNFCFPTSRCINRRKKHFFATSSSLMPYFSSSSPSLFAVLRGI